MTTCLSGVLAGLLVAVSVPAAPEPPSKKAAPLVADVRLHDGSILRMTILEDQLEVMTKYGKLTIPVSDIRRIDFGLRVPPELQRKIEEAIGLLGSREFKERDAATARLIAISHRAYPSLKRVPLGDPEVERRVKDIMKRIADRGSPELLRLKEEDVIHTAAFSVVGRIVALTIKVRSETFGEQALKLSALRTIHLWAAGGHYEIAVDAAKHGSIPDQWLDTGITVDASTRLVVTAEGQVDLWPQGPGQYLAAPKGYTAVGKGGTHMAGTLLGKAGSAGKVFVIGERYEGVPSTEGTLFLHIVPSPWNNVSTGGYRVRITTSHVLMTP